MKVLLLVVLACAVVAAAPKTEKNHVPFDIELPEEVSVENRNLLVNILVRQLINYLRYLIKNGSNIFNIPPLDPLYLSQFELNIPAGLINLNLLLEDVQSDGFGDFVVHTSNLVLSDLSFDLDISITQLNLKSGLYDLLGDFFTAIPLYGKGDAFFQVNEFRVQAKLYLKPSEDEKSVIIDRIENAAFQLPSVKSHLTGVIGGGPIDNIVNAITEEVIVGYINRFQGVISHITSQVIVPIANPILSQLDTWRYIKVLL